MDLPAGSPFASIHSSDVAELCRSDTLKANGCGRIVFEQAGRMPLPDWRIVNRTVKQPYPIFTDFPEMGMTVLEDVYCLPFAPPFQISPCRIFNDYLIPWSPGAMGWFTHQPDGQYRSNLAIESSDINHSYEIALFMDHSIFGHYGHFMGDCLPRLHAWSHCRRIFGDKIPMIVASESRETFHDRLFEAAGVSADNVARTMGLVHCKKLILPSMSMSLERYASPSSARLWARMRDRLAPWNDALPERIYVSRTGMRLRKLAQESEVEQLFGRYGFVSIQPENLPVERQAALFANAKLIAGESGSGLFNLAFQGRLRSAFVMVSEGYPQMSELLFSAGRDCELRYHFGPTMPDIDPDDPGRWQVDLGALENDVADWMLSHR